LGDAIYTIAAVAVAIYTIAAAALAKHTITYAIVIPLYMWHLRNPPSNNKQDFMSSSSD
jgi:hypothetical protein